MTVTPRRSHAPLQPGRLAVVTPRKKVGRETLHRPSFRRSTWTQVEWASGPLSPAAPTTMAPSSAGPADEEPAWYMVLGMYTASTPAACSSARSCSVLLG